MKHLFFALFALAAPDIIAQVTPPPGNALQLTGTNYVEVADHSALDLNSNTTIEGWFDFCEGDMIFSKNWCNNNGGYHLRINDDGTITWNALSVSTCNVTGANMSETSSTMYNFSEWHHFAVTVAVAAGHTTVKVYMDHDPAPALTVSAPWMIYNNTEPFRMGIYKSLSGSFTNSSKGRIKDFRVYSSVIPFNDQCRDVPSAGPIMRWEMQSGSGSIVPNSVPGLPTGRNKVNNGFATAAYLDAAPVLRNVNLVSSVQNGCIGQVIQLSSPEFASVYSWKIITPGTGIYVPLAGNDNTLTYTAAESGTYSFQITGTIGSCSISDNVALSIKGCHLSVSEEETYTPAVYPNPSSDRITIVLGEPAQDVTVRIFDTSGKIVQELRAEDNSESVNADISDLRAGVYFLRTTGKNGESGSVKVVKN
jgi:hypothetical protein